MRAARYLAIAAFLLAGCKSCSDQKPSTASPDVAAVSVERPNQPPFVIDAKLLASHPPDVRDSEWQGWKLRTLVPNWNADDLVDTIDDEGFRAPLLRAGESAGDTEPMFLLGPDGETRVIRVDPKKPITAHKGESRKDAGKTRHIAKIVFVDAASDAGVAGPGISLKVLNGAAESTWTRADLSKVKPIVLMSKDGDGERDAWNLRDLATTLVGPNAAVTEAVGEGGQTLKISPAKWKDAALTPVLRSNRRGRLKVVWLDPKTNEEDKDEVQLRGVSELHVQ